MNTLLFLFELVVGGVGLALTLPVTYQLFLAVAAWLAPRMTPLHVPAHEQEQEPQARFVVLVPAHNEETLLPRLLANLDALTYPRSLYTVHVVADNCTDRTAALAQAAGAVVHERFNTTAVGKGYALQWVLTRLAQANRDFDAAVIIDADSVVASNFLTVMDRQLAQGERVIQAYYAVRNPERAWVMRLRAAALTLVHFVRPQGRMVLGGSVGLKGNGMVFHRSILAQHEWSGSVTEDIDYHMGLVLAGERVVFAADALVWAEMPGTLQGAYSQNLRWEEGRLQLARHYVPQLWRAAVGHLRRQQWQGVVICLDSIAEHLIPPFAVLFGLTIGYAALALLLASAMLQASALYLLAGQCLYLLLGLFLARTPLQTYLALGYAPVFLVWKFWLYGRMLIGNLLGREGQGWVRTAREEV